MIPNLSPQRLFLIDFFGAIISAFSLGVVLPLWLEYIGLPLHWLHILAYIACVFALYSLVFFVTFPTYWRSLMKIIATANSLYGLLTLALMSHYFSALQAWGMAYFVLELLVLAVLVRAEWRSAK